MNEFLNKQFVYFTVKNREAGRLAGDKRSEAFYLLDKFHKEICILNHQWENKGKVDPLIEERALIIKEQLNNLLNK